MLLLPTVYGLKWCDLGGMATGKEQTRRHVFGVLYREKHTCRSVFMYVLMCKCVKCVCVCVCVSLAKGILECRNLHNALTFSHAGEEQKCDLYMASD